MPSRRMGRFPPILGTACFAVTLIAGLAAAAATERPLHRFLTVAISPDGSEVASVEGDASLNNGEPVVRSLVLRSVDGERTVSVALPCGTARECWPSSPAWSADSRTLAFALRKPGSHARSVFTVDADGNHLKEVLAFDGTIVDLRYGPGGKLAMLATEGANKEVGPTQAGAAVTGDLGGPVPEQRIAVLDKGHLDWASPPGMFVYEFAWLPSGSFVGTAAYGDGDDNWWVAKLYRFDASKSAALFSPPDRKHEIADPVASRDGKTIAFISGMMSDFGSTGGDVYSVPAAGGTAIDITPTIHGSARSIAWDCGNQLRAQFLSGGTQEFATLGSGTKATPYEILWTTGEAMRGDDGGVSLACHSSTMAAVHETFTTPQEIEVGRFGHWRDLTHANAGLTMPLKAQSISWKSDGFDVQGWLLLPLASDGKIPLVTIVHGGPASVVMPYFIGPGFVASELAKGYAFFYPNPRGSFGQGEAFTTANVRDFGHGDLRDILAGIDAVEKAAPIDDNRLAIMGGSYGGFMTMWTVTQTHRFKAAIAGAGISDWLSYYGENGIDEWMIPYFGASVYADPAIYARSSPINFIRNVKTPTFEYVGANDIECPPPQTQEFWHALHELGVPTSEAIYPGEGHGIRDPAHIADLLVREEAWFGKYLK